MLLYAEHGASSQAQRLVRRCSSGDVKATLPQTVWQDFTHKLMLAEAMMRGLTSGGNPASRALRLKADALVSSDKAFRDLDEPTVYYPTDLPP